MSTPAAGVHHLQRAVGNQATTRLLRSQPVRTSGALQGHSRIQRTCGSKNIATAVAGRAGCTDTFDNTFVGGSVFRFNANCDEFSSRPTPQEAALVALAKALSATSTVEIHGYASVDGPVDFNKDLGCARGLKARSVLTTPNASAGFSGLDPARISGPINHGPVAGAADERRSVVIRATAGGGGDDGGETPARTLPTGAFLDLQIACVTDAGGCTNTAKIPALDAQCRTTTGYNGQALVEADLVCVTPGLGIAQCLDRAYPTWRTVIPDCPCTRAAADAATNFTRDLNPFLGQFHPGADACFRSTPVASAGAPGTGHRQQCCYTRGGLLITVGGGAGTPDVWGRTLLDANHTRIDVQPFNEFQRDSRIYNRFWIPNQGSGCAASDPCLNQCEQEFERCTDRSTSSAQCIARRTGCLANCRSTPAPNSPRKGPSND